MSDWLLIAFGLLFSVTGIITQLYILRTATTPEESANVKTVILCYLVGASCFIAAIYTHSFRLLLQLLPAILILLWASTFNRLGTKILNKLRDDRAKK
jgi:hypothetical protein